MKRTGTLHVAGLVIVGLLSTACGPQSTILNATGVFEARQVDDLEVHDEDDGTKSFKLDLQGLDSGRLMLVLSPAKSVCWRSPDNQHACTLPHVEPGTLETGAFSAPSANCAVEGWLEKLGGSWQVDLEALPGATCRGGRFTATIEP